MKVAIIGSRNLVVDDFSKYIPKETTTIVSGGAKGIDSCAEQFALVNNIKIEVIKPEYEKYKKAAPILRNKIIVKKSDYIVAFWDCKSKGTAFVIDECIRQDKPCKVVYLKYQKNS